MAFAADCSCDGPVESWLQNVVDSMRAALSHEFKTAIPAYDEKPRSKWIFDYSVQNTIVVSRTFFTQASACLRSLARPGQLDVGQAPSSACFRSSKRLGEVFLLSLQ